VAEALGECLGALGPMADGQHLRVSFAADLGGMQGEQPLLMRAVSNLLQNAQREIAISVTRLPGDRIEIVVEDDGPGIPRDARERVFEPSQWLDRSRDRNTGGFGLGLSIVRQAIALHQGSVTIEDSALGGARFVIRVPALHLRAFVD
jgi:signal transduction histidine kinase